MDILQLQPPSMDFFPGNPKTRKPLRSAVLQLNSSLKVSEILFSEMVTLMRFLSKRSNKYRSDKGFKMLQKISKAVNMVYSLDMKSIVRLIKLNMVKTYLPSKQLCQWLLMKLQSYAKLLNRIVDCCSICASILYHRLRTGHSWLEIMMALSMVSRLWALSKFLLENCCQSYNTFYSVKNGLRLSEEKKWLSEKYKLPRNPLESVLKIGYEAPESEVIQSSPTSGKKKKKKTNSLMETIAQINSVKDLKTFLRREKRYRNSKSTNTDHICVTGNLDALQWHMFANTTARWLRILKKADHGKRKKLLILIRKKMRKQLS